MSAPWNSVYPVGTSVDYRRDDGSTFATKTRTEASVLSGHTAVVWVDGIAGCVSLERIRLRTEPATVPSTRNK